MFSRSTDRKILCFLSCITYSKHEASIPIISRFLSAYLGDQESLDFLVKEGLTSYDNLESSFLSYLEPMSYYKELKDLGSLKLYGTPPRLLLGCVLDKLHQDVIDFTVLGMYIFNALEGRDRYREELIYSLGYHEDPIWYVRDVRFKDFKDFCTSSDSASMPNTLDLTFDEEVRLTFDEEILYFIGCFASLENKDFISRFLSAYLGDQESLDSLVKEGLTSYDNLESSFLAYLRSDSVSGFGGDSSSIYLFDREVLYLCDKIFYYSDLVNSILEDLLSIYIYGTYDFTLEWMIVNCFIKSESTFSSDFRKHYSDALYKKGGYRLCMRL